MRLFNDAKSYATPAGALKKLDKELAKLGLTPDKVRWFLTVNAQGRFLPVVQVAPYPDGVLFGLAHQGIGIVN